MKLPQECWQFDWRCTGHREEGRSPIAWPVDADEKHHEGVLICWKRQQQAGLLESHPVTLTLMTVTMSWVRKSFFPSQGWLNLSLYAIGMCSKKNETFCLYLPYVYCEVWEQITRYFKNCKQEQSEAASHFRMNLYAEVLTPGEKKVNSQGFPLLFWLNPQQITLFLSRLVTHDVLNGWPPFISFLYLVIKLTWSLEIIKI